MTEIFTKNDKQTLEVQNLVAEGRFLQEKLQMFGQNSNSRTVIGTPAVTLTDFCLECHNNR